MIDSNKGDGGFVDNEVIPSGLISEAKTPEKNRPRCTLPVHFSRNRAANCLGTMESPSIPSTMRTERQPMALSVVFSSGYLSWYDLTQVLTVSKEWKSAIEGNAMPNDAFFQQVYDFLDQRNAGNYCDRCDGRCSCWMVDDRRNAQEQEEEGRVLGPISDSLYRMWKGDPRTKAAFHGLSVYQKTRTLFQFHAKCVQNFLSHVPDDPTPSEEYTFISTDTQFHFGCRMALNMGGDILFGMGTFQKTNPKAFSCFMSLTEILIAYSQLRQQNFGWFRKEFLEFAEGVLQQTTDAMQFLAANFPEVVGISTIFTTIIRSVWNKAAQLTEQTDMAGMDVSGFGDDALWHTSQYTKLKPLLIFILSRNDEADELLGSILADKIDMFYKSRETMTPLLEDGQGVFPLNNHKNRK